MKVHRLEGFLGGTAPRSPSLERLFFDAVVPQRRDKVSKTFFRAGSDPSPDHGVFPSA
jgi:hypothetical protein